MMPVIPPKPKKKYHGEYIGRVITVAADPEGLMRVQVRVFPLFEGVDESLLPWAQYKLPPGARAGEGVFTPCRVGDLVWVDFPFNGDSRYPRITGSVHYCPGGVPGLPEDAWAGSAYVHQRTGKEPAPVPLGYHDGSVVIEQNGVLIEIAADQSARVTQKASGAAIEIRPDGKITIHCAGELNVSSAGDTNVECQGKTTINAHGTVELKGANGAAVKGGVQGDCICSYTGQVHPMVSQTVKISL